MSMDEIIRIKCPFDGAILSVKNQPGIENKLVTCPICKQKFPFSQFKRITPAPSYQEEGETELPDMDGRARGYGAEEHTTIAQSQANFTLGRLKVVGTATSFQLRAGRNVIGRKGMKSLADFQIDTAEKRAMSREHLQIEVKKVPGKGVVHYVSLCKEKVNRTFVGNELLMYGDVLILNHGDIIRLPDATLKFEIPDEDMTETDF